MAEGWGRPVPRSQEGPSPPACRGTRASGQSWRVDVPCFCLWLATSQDTMSGQGQVLGVLLEGCGQRE